MWIYLASIATGILLVAWFPLLPGVDTLPVFILLALVLWRMAALRVACCLLLGVCWHIYAGHQMLAREIPASWEGLDIQLSGRIEGLPRNSQAQHPRIPARFQFRVSQASHQGRLLALPPDLLLRVNWYEAPQLKAGQRWRFNAKLRQPRSLASPGSFDYRAWLLARGIGASASVSKRQQPRLLGGGDGEGIRQRLADRLHRDYSDDTALPLMLALSLGDTSLLQRHHREVLVATGTAHLLVISGLHIGLCALVGYWLCYGLLALWPRWVASGLSARLAAIGAIICATGYAAMAGFTLPTQRALIMLVVCLLGRIFYRQVSMLNVLSLAALLVLVFDPLAGQSPGFYLSFGAVAVLLMPQRRSARQGLHWQFVARTLPQWRLLVAMSPLLAIWFGRISVLSPLANLPAIPFVGFAIVPLLLSGLLLAPLNDQLSGLLLDASAWLLNGFWQALLFLHGELSWLEFPIRQTGTVASICALMAALLFMLPRGVPGRLCWPLFLMPLFLPAAQIEEGLHVLDVGQGTAVLVSAGGKVLLYDSGPAAASGFNTGEAVIIPMLQQLGVAQIDHMIVSHGDNDHSGGAPALLARGWVSQWSAPTDIAGLGQPPQYCRQGQSWQWGNARFDMLGPGPQIGRSKNNQSCVLRVRMGGRSFLLTGDIEASAEARLVARYGPALASEVLLMPHHGSKTSSSYDFLYFVDAGQAVASAGYKNRFSHPAPLVVRRYQSMGTEVLTTAHSGTLSYYQGRLPVPWRNQYVRYWQQYDCSESAGEQLSLPLALVAHITGSVPGCQPSL